MISIKTCLERLMQPERETAPEADHLSGALRQGLCMVLAGLPLESASPSKGRSVMNMLLHRLTEARAPFEILEITDEALAVIEEDSKLANAHRHSRTEELQSMIAMLTETVASLSVQKDSSIARLKQIEQQIEGASMLDDMRALKANLSECLAAVREAARQQQLQSTASIERLETQIRSSKAHLTLPTPALPSDAEVVLSDEPEQLETGYAAIFLLDRADLISRRYGESVRSEVVNFVRQHFKKMMMPKDRFIRWNGAAFVILLQRKGSSEDVSAELRSVASLGRSQYFAVGDRSVLLDTSLTWTVFPQTDFASPDLFFKAVDDFIKQAAAERQAPQAKARSQPWPIKTAV
ncbi:MAG TPA: diguanylate cyclase [Bryobacteraceae bacterium]|nr:diguanylate cyclase [Bryobacteraceae bacterium]